MVGRPGNNARLELGLGPGGALLLFIWLQTGGRGEEEIRPIVFLACSKARSGLKVLQVQYANSWSVGNSFFIVLQIQTALMCPN